MPCVHPMPAWRTQAGIITFDPRERAASREELQMPCGTCIGCNKSKAQAWALRCLLELQQHQSATFTTLTYEPGKEPTTGLSKRDLQLFLKRLRKKIRKESARTIRFFAAGEYGEKTNRPHYHAILFSCNAEMDRMAIEKTWGKGHAYTVPVTHRAISYTAGYCAKKYENTIENKERWETDYETGEYYLAYQPPFLQMSRGGKQGSGIGGAARKHTESWRDYAVLNGTRFPVPEYLHQAWEETATAEEIENREHEKYLRSLTKERMTQKNLEAQEQIERTKQKLKAERRKI